MTVHAFESCSPHSMWGCGPVEDEAEARILRGILGAGGVDPGVDQSCNVDAERDAQRDTQRDAQRDAEREAERDAERDAERTGWTPEQRVRLHAISRSAHSEPNRQMWLGQGGGTLPQTSRVEEVPGGTSL